MPIWLLISILQLFVPLVTILRACCIESVRHYAVHWISSLIILIGVIINLVTLREDPDDDMDEKDVSNHRESFLKL